MNMNEKIPSRLCGQCGLLGDCCCSLPECSICHKTFKENRYLYMHQAGHRNKEIECKLCNIKLKRKADLKVHMISHGQNVPQYECSICGHKFAKKSNLGLP